MHYDKLIGTIRKRRTKEKIKNNTKISNTSSKENNRTNKDIVNSNSVGENDNGEYKNKCEEQRRESFAFRNDEGVRQRLEKEENDANDLYDKNDRYQLKRDG